jgi:hypothetical protein
MPDLIEKERLSGSTVESRRLLLDDGEKTTMHIARYLLSAVKPRVVVFDEPTYLLSWCATQGIKNAISGGYFLRQHNKLVGEVWINGAPCDYEPIAKGWDKLRGAACIDSKGSIELAPRNELPLIPEKDLLQAGPLLLRNGKQIMPKNSDIEGFFATSHQHDPNAIPTEGRFPRVAIGTSSDSIWCVAADGRSAEDVGLTVEELASTMQDLGIENALALDGGSSSCLINGGKLINKPRGGERDNFRLFTGGRPLHSAIVFDPLEQ